MKHIVIVDAFSTGKYLAPLFNAHNYNCIHIQSTLDINPQLSAQVEKTLTNFVMNIIYDNDLDDIIRQLNHFSILCVISGSEWGVSLADAINHRLQLPYANVWELSAARRDKYQMQQALVRQGVRSVASVESTDVNEILQWVSIHNQFPVVVKPLSSALSEKVFFCNQLSEVKQAFGEILHSKNILSGVNTSVLAQEFIAGTEYVVNTVSCRGQHFITDIWRSQRIAAQNHFIYDKRELVTHHSEAVTQLIEYTKTALDALGIKNGAAHSELIIDETGPVLIEAGARLVGAINPRAFTEALGYNAISLLVESILHPENFLRMIQLPTLPVYQHLWIVHLISDTTGVMIDRINVDELTQIAGFHSIYDLFYKGMLLQKTTDIRTSPGLIYLLSDDLKILQQGYDRIRQIELHFYKSIVVKQVGITEQLHRFSFLPKLRE